MRYRESCELAGASWTVYEVGDDERYTMVVLRVVIPSSCCFWSFSLQYFRAHFFSQTLDCAFNLRDHLNGG